MERERFTCCKFMRRPSFRMRAQPPRRTTIYGQLNKERTGDMMLLFTDHLPPMPSLGLSFCLWIIPTFGCLAGLKGETRSTSGGAELKFIDPITLYQALKCVELHLISAVFRRLDQCLM